MSTIEVYKRNGVGVHVKEFPYQCDIIGERFEHHAIGKTEAEAVALASARWNLAEAGALHGNWATKDFKP